MEFKIGDTVSYSDLTGKIINIFDSASGSILEIECPARKPNELDTILWVPESELAQIKL